MGDWDAYSGDYLNGGTATAFSQTRTHNPVHEILGVNSDSTDPGLAGGAVKHDAKGNIIEESTRGPGPHLHASTPTTCWRPPACSAAGRDAGSYTYDAIGRRVTKTTSSGTTVFVSLTEPDGFGPGPGDPGVRRRFLRAEPAERLRQLRGRAAGASDLNRRPPLLPPRPAVQRRRAHGRLRRHRAGAVPLHALRPARRSWRPMASPSRTASSFHAGQTPGTRGCTTTRKAD